MIASAISAVRSCYSPSLYYYAAHEKDGLGLWFLFGVAWIAILALYVFGFYTVGEGFPGVFLASVGAHFEQAGVILPVARHPASVFFLITLFSALSIMLTLFNVAIIYAMPGVVINILMNATLGYMEVLRITVYAQVASYMVIIALGISLHQMGVDPGWIQYAFIPLMLGYMCFGIYSAK